MGYTGSITGVITEYIYVEMDFRTISSGGAWRGRVVAGVA